MTPCGHCFHMSCIQQWADAAPELMEDYDEDEDDEDRASRLCCPFCRKKTQHKMRLFLELPQPFALEEEEVPFEQEADDMDQDDNDEDEGADQQERKMPATRSITAKEKEIKAPPAASTRSGRKRPHDQLQDNTTTNAKVAKKANADHHALIKLTKENKVLKNRVRQLQNKLVLQSRKHLAHERQQVDEMENLMTAAKETKKNLALEQRRVRKCMLALDKFRDVDHGLQALVTRAFSEKEEAATNLAKLEEIHETICSKLQLRSMPHRTAKAAVASNSDAAAATSSSTSTRISVQERKVLNHWFKRHELENIQKTLEEINQMFQSDNDDDDHDDDEDQTSKGAAAQRRITRSLSRQQQQQT